MMEALYAVPFSVLEVPNLKIKRPSWFHQPSAMTVFAMVLLSYFMVTGGIHGSEFISSINELELTNKRFMLQVLFMMLLSNPRVSDPRQMRRDILDQ